MGRRYQEIEERASRDVAGAKEALKRLGDRERALVLAWLCTYVDDDGAIRVDGAARRRVTLDQVDFWLVPVPTKKRMPPRWHLPPIR
jgi:hypothetical protein